MKCRCLRTLDRQLILRDAYLSFMDLRGAGGQAPPGSSRSGSGAVGGFIGVTGASAVACVAVACVVVGCVGVIAERVWCTLSRGGCFIVFRLCALVWESRLSKNFGIDRLF